MGDRLNEPLMSKPVLSQRPTPGERPSAMGEPWWKTPWARRMGFTLGGGVMLALCPFLPWPPARAICVAAGQVISGAAVSPLDDAFNPFDGGTP